MRGRLSALEASLTALCATHVWCVGLCEQEAVCQRAVVMVVLSRLFLHLRISKSTYKLLAVGRWSNIGFPC